MGITSLLVLYTITFRKPAEILQHPTCLIATIVTYSNFPAGTTDDLVCGNGKIDDQWEECDGGFLGQFGLDPCCTNECLLTSGSQCRLVTDLILSLMLFYDL